MPLRRTYRALRHQVGYRGTVLLAFGFLDLGYGYGLLYPDRATSRGPSFAYYDSVLSSNIWGLLWLIAGVVLIWHAFRRDDKVGYVVAIVVKVWWSSFNLIGWWTWPGMERGWVTGVIFAVFGVFVFSEASRPEPHPHVPELDDEEIE